VQRVGAAGQGFRSSRSCSAVTGRLRKSPFIRNTLTGCPVWADLRVTSRYGPVTEAEVAADRAGGEFIRRAVQ
jgi:hypothetical protein